VPAYFLTTFQKKNYLLHSKLHQILTQTEYNAFEMALQPIGHNAQVQRLTTALKNICRDYPAGGTVLRELLQNADDAGATEVVCNLRLLTTSRG
jgi:hypothetical protein